MQRDYLLEIIAQFVATICAALREAQTKHSSAACTKIEEQVSELLSLDAQTALTLTPESLVGLMDISGKGFSVAPYAAYVLDRLSDIYDEMGESECALLRRSQAEAIALRFGVNLLHVPKEFDQIDQELFA